MLRYVALPLIALLASLVLGSGGPPALAPALPPVTLADLHGKLYLPPRAAFDFALPASTGEVAGPSVYRGQVVLLFFGYTSCPDVCPTTLAEIKQALAQLGAAAQGITVLMLSVDPARDTPAHLAEYLGYFHESGYVGLSGSEAAVAEVAYHYGAQFYREPATTTGGGYSVAHTTRLFLLNRQGEWVMTMPYGTTPIQLATNLRYWLNN